MLFLFFQVRYSPQITYLHRKISLKEKTKKNPTLKYYQKILITFEDGDIVGHNETECKDLVQAGRLNIALCWMKLKEWKEAKDFCTKVC